ncbi:hypothetical protein ABEB36_014172 [Hypothenemus hampei]|uniref:Myb/SANT-like DNA-binding domain-containing protein n=1 Tax=Hypothenemus hampei TaxID=57062 RepID=A0ABD1E3Q9_HYPHA
MDVINNRTYGVVYTKNNEPYIDEEGNVLLKNLTDESYVFVEMTENIKKGFQIQAKVDDTPKENVPPTKEDQKMWSEENILQLINLVDKYDKEFSTSIKKNVWIKIGSEFAQINTKITAQDCETKWKALKRTYKSILLHNNTSGQKRRRWPYFEVIHKFLYKKPEITPPAVCSNIVGLQTNAADNHSLPSTSSTEVPSTLASDNESDPDSHRNFAAKRKLKANAIDIRHKEKMQRLDRFNDLFAEMIKKM